MKRGVNFDDYLAEQLKSESFRRAYEEEGIYVELAILIARLREKKGLTQRQLARQLKTSQQTISRIESPQNDSLSLRTLIKLAHALGKQLKVQLV